MRQRLRSSITNLVAATLLVGCASAQSGSAQSNSPVPPTSSTPIVPIGPAKARADSARYPYTAADVQFMSHMIAHHAQAIVMARWAPTHGASAAVQTLAGRIINAQQDEIALMQNWLRDRNQPVPEARAGPVKMTMNGMEHMMLMPGMLTDEQMKQLDAARGEEFDRLFLTFMIQHHRGATAMVSDLFSTNGAAQDETVFKFANDVNVDQSTEIARMQKMLAAVVFGTSAP